MNAQQLIQLGARLYEISKEHGHGAIGAVRAGVGLGFELAAMAARQRGLETFALELEQSGASLLRTTEVYATQGYAGECNAPAPVGNSRCCRGRGHPGDHWGSPLEGWPQKVRPS